MKKIFFCPIAIIILLTLAFPTYCSMVNAAQPEVQAPPTYPTGIKQYEGVLIEENTSNEFNVTIYVNFDNQTVFVDLWNGTTTVLDNEAMSVTLAKNKTVGWGVHLFFKATSADKNVKLMVNELKRFTLCNMVATGVAYNGYVVEIQPE